MVTPVDLTGPRGTEVAYITSQNETAAKCENHSLLAGSKQATCTNDQEAGRFQAPGRGLPALVCGVLVWVLASVVIMTLVL